IFKKLFHLTGYVTNVLDDAQLYSSHAKRKGIEVEDVKLAITLQQEKNFTSPPARELTAEMARQRNSMALPIIKSSAGLRLPPDRYSLTACNYRLKQATKKTRTVHTVSRLNIASLPQNTVNKSSTPMTMNKQTPALSVVTKANASPAASLITRPATTIPKSVPTPIIKFSDANRMVTSSSALSPVSTSISTAPSSTSSPQILMPTCGIAPSSTSSPQILMPTCGIMNSMMDAKCSVEATNGTKRKREEDDDDYDV
ncbi:transcription initiation factor TFIID subunit 9-like, partial [Stegodyphus dumicola]|uniref:transcription initiation factor TFIID subunit 9-like n=1 Tax=Stegodyphus dumicola TaxID=202533 RepID=UPI0015A98390